MIYTFYDLETSGLIKSTSEAMQKGGRPCDILQFAYLQINFPERQFVANKFYLWQEDFDWTQGAYEVNGLSKDFLREHGAMDMNEKYSEMYRVMSRANRVGFNNHYFDDEVFYDFMYRRALYPQESSVNIDVMQLARKALNRRSISLINLCNEFKITEPVINAFVTVYFGDKSHAHDAAYDVVATYLCFLELGRLGYVQT